MKAPRLRIASFNDVYVLNNLPKLQTFLRKLYPRPDIVCLCGDFLSPSVLSSLDNGKGMVATLRAIGISHVILGNHEADLKLPVLEKRLQKLQKSAVIVNSNVGKCPELTRAEWLRHLPSYDIVSTRCGRVKVGLLGLLSDEMHVMRSGKFRGIPIQNVCETFETIHNGKFADWLLPLTHQCISRDKELAEHMLQVQTGSSIILGGHEHVPYDETVYSEGNSSFVRIFKSGQDAQAIRLLDLSFDVDEWNNKKERLVQLGEVKQDLIDITSLEPSATVQRIVDSHLELLHALDNEHILYAQDLLQGQTLSSERTRYEQTTVGGIFCTCIKEELETDAAIFNGAPIKGNRIYPDNKMTYAQLKAELPFPAKIVVLSMTRRELLDAIQYSRTNPPGDNVERKGYLQVDLEFARVGFKGDPDDVLKVALPRNLMKGFCEIRPLMDLGDRLELEGKLPSEDDYVPAVQLVTRHCNKEKWYELVHDHYTFDDLDIDQKGYLTRDDVHRMLRKALLHDPPEFVVNDMIEAIDIDANGVIDPNEFSHMLAVMEREHGLLQADKSDGDVETL